MPFQRPNLQDLINRNITDLETRLPATDARLRYSLLGAIAHMQAGATHSLHGHLDWNAKQLLPVTAEEEYQALWASIWGKHRQAATFASGNIIATGTDGSIIPAGSQWQRFDEELFISTAEATISAGTATVPVIAVTIGENGNTDASRTLQITTPLVGVNSTVAVDSNGLTGGSDIETDESLLSRLLERIQAPPHGGTADDYVNWTLEVPGVTRAWCYPLVDASGVIAAGMVTVRFMMDDTYSDGIPLAGDISTIQSHLNSQAPAVATVVVVAPTPKPLDMVVALNPNTVDVQAAVEWEIKSLLLRSTAPGGLILLSKISEAISIAAGEVDHDIVSINGLTPANVSHAFDEIAVPGTITWQTL